MISRSLISRLATAGAAAAVVVVSAPSSPADDARTLESGACDAWDLTYTLNANLELRDTPMGEGDGVYAIGPGTVTLRFETPSGGHVGDAGGSVKMLAYAMREHFQIVSKTLFWTTTVTTDTNTAVTPDACRIVAEGTVAADHALRWTTPVRGYHTDGWLTCDGSLCGKFGAPPQGRTELHIGPNNVPFSPFAFTSDMKTFHMPFTFVSKTDMPKQTGYLALAGREIRRVCAQGKTCK